MQTRHPRQNQPSDGPAKVDITYREDLGILVARTSGVLRPGDWKEIIGRMLEKGRPYDCTRYLTDHRNAIIPMQFTEVLKALPKNPVDFKAPAGVRIAVLVTSAIMQEKEFFEAYFRNRGRDFRVFEDESLALSWLSEPKPSLLDFP